MKYIIKKIADFFRREWFLLVILTAISLIVFLFESF